MSLYQSCNRKQVQRVMWLCSDRRWLILRRLVP